MAQKSKRNFDLGKKSERNFSINKGSGRKFDISKSSDEDEEIVVAPEEVAPEATPVEAPVAEEAKPAKPQNTIDTEEETENKGSKKWIIIVALILVGALVWWFATKDSESTEPEDVTTTEVISQDEQTEVAEETEVSAEEIAEPAEEPVATPAEEAVEESAEETTTPAPQQEEVESTPVVETPAPVVETPAPTAKPETVASATIKDLEGKTVEQKAKSVIRGDFGVGAERKEKLGAQYAEIQSMVNEMIRKGDIYQ